MTSKTFKLGDHSNNLEQSEAPSSHSITPIKARVRTKYYEPTESFKKKVVKPIRKKDKLQVDEEDEESEDSEYEYSPDPTSRNAAQQNDKKSEHSSSES